PPVTPGRAARQAPGGWSLTLIFRFIKGSRATSGGVSWLLPHSHRRVYMKSAFSRPALLAALAAACLAGAVQAEEIKRRFAAPLTGPQSHYGEDMQNGLTMALEEANKKGIKVDGEVAKF